MRLPSNEAPNMAESPSCETSDKLDWTMNRALLTPCEEFTKTDYSI